MSRFKCTVLLFLFGCSCIFFVNPHSHFARAESVSDMGFIASTQPFDPSQSNLDMSISATRNSVPAMSVPQSLKIIKAEELVERKQVGSVPDSLSGQAGVLLQKTSRGQGSPFIRGFTGFRNLFLIDGIRLNNSVMRDGPNQYWNTVDIYSIDRLEVVKGSSSVLYGSDAIGGTILATTRDLFAGDMESRVNSRLLLRYASAENAVVQRAEIAANRGRDFAVHLGGSRKFFGDVRAGVDTGLQPETGFAESGFDLKAQAKLTARDNVSLAWQKTEQDDVWRTHSTIYGRSFRGTKIGKDLHRSFDQARELSYIKHKHTFETGFLTNVESSLSYQVQEESEIRILSNASRIDQGLKVHTQGASVQAQSDLASGVWTYGVEFYRDLVDSQKLSFASSGEVNSKSIQGPVADDSTYENLGFFLQDQYRFGSDFELTSGLRHNMIVARIGRFEDPRTEEASAFDENYSATVGNFRGSFDFGGNRFTKFFAGVAQGFRAPNLSDLTRFDIARSKELEIPAIGLSPEKFTSYEIGSRWGDSKKVLVEMWLFRTDIRNMIIRAPNGDTSSDDTVVVTKKNAGEGYVQGAELDAYYHFKSGYSINGNYTFQWGELETYPSSSGISKREPMSRIMPATLNLTARGENEGCACWAEALYTLVRRQDRLSTADRLDDQRIPPGGSPGYKIYGLRAGGKIMPGAKLSVALENILNTDFRILGSGVNEPGRNFVATLDVKF
jgi:hemoglobin/transferrin/lactoferrin receptor protein